MDKWYYVCKGKGIEDVNVPIAFLEIGGGFAHKIRVEGFQARKGDLTIMKADTYASHNHVEDDFYSKRWKHAEIRSAARTWTKGTLRT